jgi:hypothetical protein
MNHPELFVVPVLMLADYWLTILGARYARLVYRKHFVIRTYELNPTFRAAVDRLQWINFKHLCIVLVTTGSLMALDRWLQVPDLPFDYFQFLLGGLYGLFAMVCGRHLTNLLLFLYLNRHPETLAGEVRMSMSLVLRISQFTYVGFVPVLCITAAGAPDALTCGLLFGSVIIVLVHSTWDAKLAPEDRYVN